MPQHPQSPQTHSQPCHPLHLEILSGKTQAVYPSPHIHIPGQQNWGEGRGQRGCRPWQGPPPPGAAKGHPKTPGHAATLLCPHDTHPNLWGTPLPLPTPSPLPLQTPTAPQLPQLRGWVLISQEISLGRGRAPATPHAGGFCPDARGGVSPYLVCARGDPSTPRPWLQGTGCPRPCCSPGRRQRVLIEFLDYPGGEIVISLNPTSGRVP